MVRTRDSVGELEIRSSADEAERGPGFLDLTGREIGRYRIQKRLGRGGVTTVYQAYDIVDDIPVALKVLLHGNDEKLYNRFRQEAQTAAKLHHPHIVRTLRVGVTPGSDSAYIAMELVEGEDLAAMLAMRRRLTPEETCLLLHPIARALAYAHEHGIVHRDVKPSNILLRTGVSPAHPLTHPIIDNGPAESGAAGSVILDALDYPVVPLLGDFGIARALDLPELTSWGRTVGTPAFMAPEQARGQRQVDHRADIYALGAVFYRCVTGRPPFSGTTVQILHAHVYDSVTISDDVQRQLSQRHVQLLQRSLAKDPADRYESALAMADDLLRGSDPTTDELTAAEREIGTTLTLELVSVGAPNTAAAQQNILIPADGAMRTTGAQPHNASHTPVNQPVPSGTEQHPVDPNFDPELDQRLQRWATMLLSVILTLFVLAALFYLLRKPYQDVLNLLLSPAPHPVPALLSPTDLPPTDLPPTDLPPTKGNLIGETEESATGQSATDQIAWAGVGIPMRSLGSASLRQQQRLMPTDPVISQTQPADPVSPHAYKPEEADNGSLLSVVDATPTVPIVVSPMPATPIVLPSQDPRPPPILTQAPLPLEPFSTVPFTPTVVTGVSTLGADVAEQISGHCTSVIDSRLRDYVLALQPPLRKSFRCATDRSIYGEGEYLAFQQGYMLYLSALDLMFVSYYGRYNEIESPWEVFEIGRLNPALEIPVTPVAPEDLLFYPTQKFAIAWQQAEVRERLGMAVTPDSSPVLLVAQKFNQGWLVLREASGAENAATLYTYPIVERFF